jgi:hypothetical protein
MTEHRGGTPAGALLAVALVTLCACDKKSPTDGTPPPPSASVRASVRRAALGDSGSSKVDVLSGVRIRSKDATNVRFAWKTPPGTAVNDDAPFRIRWDSSSGLAEAPADVKSTGRTAKEGFSVKVRPMPTAPSASLEGELSLVVCDSANHAICLDVQRSVEVHFVVADDATPETSVTISLPPAK